MKIPSRTASNKDRLPAFSLVAIAVSTSLRWTWATRSKIVDSELHGIGAADQQMAGVERPSNVGVCEYALDIVLGLDERAHVRMDGLDQSVLGTDLVDRRKSHGTSRPLGVGQWPARRPVGVDHDGCDEACRAEFGQVPCDGFGLASGGLAADAS